MVIGGFEYYGDYGEICNFASLHNQEQQSFVVTNLNVSPKWEINIGAGIGPTAATRSLDHQGDSGAALLLDQAS